LLQATAQLKELKGKYAEADSTIQRQAMLIQGYQRSLALTEMTAEGASAAAPSGPWLDDLRKRTAQGVAALPSSTAAAIDEAIHDVLGGAEDSKPIARRLAGAQAATPVPQGPAVAQRPAIEVAGSVSATRQPQHLQSLLDKYLGPALGGHQQPAWAGIKEPRHQAKQLQGWGLSPAHGRGSLAASVTAPHALAIAEPVEAELDGLLSAAEGLLSSLAT